MDTSDTTQEGQDLEASELDVVKLTPGLKTVAGKVFAQLTEFDSDTRMYTLKPVEAFAVCLAVAHNDPRAAALLLIDLHDGLQQWNVMAEGNAKDFPLP